jgi:hypothetical protein
MTKKRAIIDGQGYELPEDADVEALREELVTALRESHIVELTVLGKRDEPATLLVNGRTVRTALVVEEPDGQGLGFQRPSIAADRAPEDGDGEA